MWQYTGAADQTRVHKEEFSTNELEATVRLLTTLTAEGPFLGEPPVAPYGESNQLPEVNFYLQSSLVDVESILVVGSAN
jgi:hypothetical protein